MTPLAAARREATEALARWDRNHGTQDFLDAGDALRALLAALPETPAALNFVCTDFPGPGNECVFVECEDGTGRSVNAGEWVRRPDGLVALVVSRLAQPAPPAASDEVREALAAFGAVCLREWWGDGNPGDIDGGAAQEAAEEAGLWHQVERHADGVECEWCGNEGPCGEMTAVGLAALSRPALTGNGEKP